MRTVGLFLCTVLICSAGNAMDKIEIIRDIPDMPKDRIYASAKQWVAQNFVSAQDVIQFDDKEAGTLIMKGNMDFPCSSAWTCTATGGDIVKFTMKIDVKDQKIRVGIDNVSVSQVTGTILGRVEKSLSKRQETILNKRLSGLTNSVIYSVETASEIKNDDW